MRPVNLIPEDQRRVRGAGVKGNMVTYGFLGVLAGAVLIVSALVITSNQINDGKEKVAELEGKAARSERAAKALEAYGNFARIEQARVATVKGLAESRFNWERVLRALSKTIPEDVWLTAFKGTVSPDIEIESEGGGGGTGTLREKTTAPAIELVGCTYSHKAVARMMVRMRNIDGVSEVALSKSERPESQTSSAAPVEGDSAAGSGGSGGDCRTKPEITKFELLVVLANAHSQGTAPAGDGATPTPAAQTQPSAPPTGASAAPQTPPAATGASQ
jgi:Tfp pilus assembly protein PilN